MPSRSVPNSDAVAAAREAGLRYVSDAHPGIRRRRVGGRGSAAPAKAAFTYIGVNGRVIRSRDEIARISRLAVPPAWTDVWICPDPRGHIQATGRDARGRKQYRYHPGWRASRDENKYGRMIAFAEALPIIRRRTNADLAKPGLPREKVLAAVVQLLEKSLIRVGNDEYARDNRSFGLTTLRNHHAKVRGSSVEFTFRGKSGVKHAVGLDDARLARIVKACQELPGQELFEYFDGDGERCDVGSAEVNAYLKEITGQDFTAKDFRTWAGTVLAARALQEFEAVDSQARAKKNVLQAIEAVAGVLGNTKTVCRKSYIHPAVIDGYMDGTMAETLRRRVEKARRRSTGLRPEEAAVLRLLQARLAREARKKKAA
jgi:DNA topoisomerase-1